MPILVNSADLPDEPGRGPVWSIAEPDRQLDTNLIRLPAGEEIPAHRGAEVDTLIHVTRGSGTLATDEGEHALRPGDVAFLRRRSVRGFHAGPDGLEYLTVHRSRGGLGIGSGPPD